MGTYVCTREFCAPDEEPAIDMGDVLDVELAMMEMEFENL
jgi:hypothetical protein